jgi:hypothetical protein
VHNLGQEIIRLRDVGAKEQAEDMAKELCKVRDQVLALLARLQIAVALSNDRATKPAQRAD